jgi:hypothetical protein
MLKIDEKIVKSHKTVWQQWRNDKIEEETDETWENQYIKCQYHENWWENDQKWNNPKAQVRLISIY